jgi:hypothetical protein
MHRAKLVAAAVVPVERLHPKAVSEPASALVFGIAVVALLVMRRKISAVRGAPLRLSGMR